MAIIKSPDYYAHCGGAIGIFKIGVQNEIENPVFNHLRVDIFNGFLKEANSEVFATKMDELLALTNYKYERDPRIKNLDEAEISTSLSGLKVKGVLENYKIEEGIIKYKISNVLKVITKGEIQILKLMFSEDEFLNYLVASKAKLKLLQLILLRSNTKVNSFNDMTIEIGEFFAGKTKGCQLLGITPDEFSNGISEFLDKGIIKITKTLSLHRHSYHKYTLCRRFFEGVDIYYVPFEGSELDIEEKLKRQEYFEKVLGGLSKEGGNKVTFEEGASVISYLDSLLPTAATIHDITSIEKSEEFMAFLKTVTVTNLHVAVNKIKEESDIRLFTTRAEIRERLKEHIIYSQDLSKGSSVQKIKPRAEYVFSETKTTDNNEDNNEDLSDVYSEVIVDDEVPF